MRERERERWKKGLYFLSKIYGAGRSSRVEPRLKVGVLDEGNMWTPKSGVFVRDSSEEFGKSKVSNGTT